MRRSSSAPGSKPGQSNPGRAEPRGNSFSDEMLRHLSPIITAVMIDAAFFLKRARVIYGKLKPEDAARRLHQMALEHLNEGQGGKRVARLYRIFVYDAPPVEWKGHKPISRQVIDLSRETTPLLPILPTRSPVKVSCDRNHPVRVTKWVVPGNAHRSAFPSDRSAIMYP